MSPGLHVGHVFYGEIPPKNYKVLPTKITRSRNTGTIYQFHWHFVLLFSCSFSVSIGILIFILLVAAVMGDCLLWLPSAVSHCMLLYYDVSYLVNKLSLSLSLLY